eukprot:110555-Pelagomonas_calceolata.AAC.2
MSMMRRCKYASLPKYGNIFTQAFALACTHAAGYLDDLRYVVQKAKQAFLSAVRRSDGYQPVLDLKS